MYESQKFVLRITKRANRRPVGMIAKGKAEPVTPAKKHTMKRGAAKRAAKRREGGRDGA